MAKQADPSPTDRRYFISVETDFFDHPKTLAIGPQLAFAVLASWAYCHKQLTDGVLPAQAAKQILPLKRDRDRLVKHGWWEETRGGYAVHDYLKHQPSRVLMRRKSDAARNAAGIRWSVRANAEQHAGEGGEEASAESGKRTTDHAERIADGNAKGNAERNAKGNASGNAERNAEPHAESMQSKSYSQIQTYPQSDSSRTPRARADDDPFSAEDADRSRDQARRGGVRHVAGAAAKVVAAAQRRASA